MALQDAQPGDPLIGARIDGRYTIHGILGRGGMGVVYDGVHDELARPVAIKVLNAAWASDPTAVARFLREARTAGSLSHGNIVDVSDLGRLPDGRPYLVMPKVRGTDLASMLRQGGPQPPKRVAVLLAGVAAALDLIHAKGLVHRDIKPENLMYVVREDGSETVMLLDFGIAALVASNEPRLTRQGAIFGTPEYLPPEVWDGKVPDRRGDVYALATVAFELMTSELPFMAENVMHLLPMKLKSDAPSMASVSAMTFSAELEAVIARGLAREPSDRFDTASELVEALRAATARAPVSWRPGVLSTQQQTPARATVLEHESGKNLARSMPASEGSAALALPDAREEVLSPTTDSAVLAMTARQQNVWQAAASASDTRSQAAPSAVSAGFSPRVASSSARRWLGYIGVGTAIVLLLGVWALSSPSEPPAHVARPAPQPSPPQRAAQTPEPEPAVPTPAQDISPEPSPTAPTAEPRAPLPVARARQAASTTRITHTPPPIAKPSAPIKPGPAPPVVEITPAAAMPLTTATKPVATPAPAPAKPAVPAVKERDPVQAAQLTREGTSALLGGQVAHATDLLRRATEADPSYAGAFRSLGLTLEQTGHPRDAIDAYQRYLALEPRGAQADKVRERVQALKR